MFAAVNIPLSGRNLTKGRCGNRRRPPSGEVPPRVGARAPRFCALHHQRAFDRHGAKGHPP